MLKVKRWVSLSAPYKGILLMCLSVFMYSLSNVFIKTSAEIYPLGQMIVYRGFIFLILLTFYLLFVYKKNILSVFHTHHLKTYIIQGILSALFLFLFYYAFKVMPLSDATVLNFSETFILTLFSILLLKEKVSKNIWISLIIGFIGILFIATPSLGNTFTTTYQKGILACIFAVSIDAFVLISFRRLVQTDKIITILVYYALCTTLAGFFSYPFEVWIPLKTGPYFQLAGLGIMSAFGQIFVIQAFRHASTGTVAPFIYTMMIWTLIFDILIWGHIPNFSVWIGFGFICLSSLYIIHQEHLKEKEKEKKLNLMNLLR